MGADPGRRHGPRTTHGPRNLPRRPPPTRPHTKSPRRARFAPAPHFPRRAAGSPETSPPRLSGRRRGCVPGTCGGPDGAGGRRPRAAAPALPLTLRVHLGHAAAAGGCAGQQDGRGPGRSSCGARGGRRGAASLAAAPLTCAGTTGPPRPPSGPPGAAPPAGRASRTPRCRGLFLLMALP